MSIRRLKDQRGMKKHLQNAETMRSVKNLKVGCLLLLKILIFKEIGRL